MGISQALLVSLWVEPEFKPWTPDKQSLVLCVCLSFCRRGQKGRFCLRLTALNGPDGDESLLSPFPTTPGRSVN